MYGVSITTHFTKSKLKTTHIKLYKIIKDEKNKIQYKYIKDIDFQKGIVDSLYDLMNFVSTQED
ncbi:MAG: hypothetical protein U9O86_04080 [Campylobacterota bacterium]|nr:hypothetical protein [Campylobacterota bacterium]